MTPDSFQTFAGIGFDHNMETRTRQALSTELFMQLIGARTRGECSDIDALRWGIEFGDDIERSWRRADCGRTVIHASSKTMGETAISPETSNNVIDPKSSEIAESAKPQTLEDIGEFGSTEGMNGER